MKLCTELCWEHDKIPNLSLPSYPILQDNKHTSPAKPSSTRALSTELPRPQRPQPALAVSECLSTLPSHSQQRVRGGYIHLPNEFGSVSNIK